MTTSTANSSTINNTHITTTLSYDDTAVTWQTNSVSVRIRIWFVCTTPVTDANNTLTISGSASGSWANALNINYATGTFLILDTTKTVTLTNSSQTFTLTSTLSNVGYAGTDLKITGQTMTIMAKPPSISQPTYNVTSLNTGDTLTVTTNRQNSAFTHKWYYKVPSGSYTSIGTGITTSSSYTIPVNVFGAMMVNTATRTFVFLLETYDGSNNYIGSVTTNITITMQANAIPTISSVTAVESSGTSSVNTIVGAFVKSLSKLTVTVNGAAGVYGSTITKTEIIINGVAVVGSPITTDYITNSGSVTVTGRVTDSRGRVGTKDLVITVLDYTPPKITSLIVMRSDNTGTLSVTGTYGKATSVGNITTLLNGTEKNQLTYALSSRVRGTTTWTTQKAATNLAVGTLTLNANDVIGAGGFSATTAYELKLDVSDKFNTTSSIYIMPIATVTLSLADDGVGVGKVWQRGSIDAAGDIYESGIKLYDRYGIRQGRKNALINAVGFPINQRNASSISASGYFVDKWRLNQGAGSANTLTLDAATLGITTGFHDNYIAWNRTTVGTGVSSLEQYIESVTNFSGQTVTVSVLCNLPSAGAVDFYPNFTQSYGTGGTPSADVNTAGATLTCNSTSMQLLTTTVTLPNVSGTLGTAGNDYLRLQLSRPISGNGQTGTINIYAVQVELGSIASPFETPSIAETLAMCQRYYWRQDASKSVYTIFAQAMTYSTNTAYIIMQFPVPLRIAPTSSNFAWSGPLMIHSYTSGYGVTALSLNAGSSTTVIELTATVESGLVTTGNAWRFMSNNSTDAFISIGVDL